MYLDLGDDCWRTAEVGRVVTGPHAVIGLCFPRRALCLLLRHSAITQVRAMQKGASLTAISLPTVERQSNRHQADSSFQVCAYAFPRAPSRPQRPELAPRPHLRSSFRSAEDLVG